MIVAFFLACSIAESCFAWSEGGHHLIAVMAYELLGEEEQRELQSILAAHPRYAEDFVPPPQVMGEHETELWRIGRAGYWPDIARSQQKYNRPDWHYELRSTLSMGENLTVPEAIEDVPSNATLETKDLHIIQAVKLCRRVLREKTNPNSDRAIAICWLAHLVADAHQPCHAGSLYYAGVFPEGDRGGNSIPTKQSKNLHALWDGLLGQKFDAGDVKRRAKMVMGFDELVKMAVEITNEPLGLNPEKWIVESSEAARTFVYTPEILSAVDATARGSRTLETIALSEEYLTTAGKAARYQACFAAHRLAAIWRDALK